MESQKNDTSYDALIGYNKLDPFKRLCQKVLQSTNNNAAHLDVGARLLEWTRGESVQVYELCNQFIGHVEEGLGTKNLVADEVHYFDEYRVCRASFYDSIAQDTAAMILNDMATLGVMPVGLAMHLAVGDASWFDNQSRVDALINGWKKSCDIGGCIGGGGETPTVRGIVEPKAALLSGSAFGMAFANKLLNPAHIQVGDVIVLLDSSGIHANGLTKAREIATQVEGGYAAKLSDGRMFGEALLDPTVIYSRFIGECLKHDVRIHYGVHMTGHGWRKLMRARQPFRYVVDSVPEPQPVFKFIQKHGKIDDREAYSTYNMGAGFALYLPNSDLGRLGRVLEMFSKTIRARVGGHIEKAETSSVVLKQLGITYEADTLAVR